MADSSIDLEGVNLWYVKEKTQTDLVSTSGVRLNKKNQHRQNTICPALRVWALHVTLIVFSVRLRMAASPSQPGCMKWTPCSRPSGVYWRWVRIFLPAVTGVCMSASVSDQGSPRSFISYVSWGREAGITVRPLTPVKSRDVVRPGADCAAPLSRTTGGTRRTATVWL